MRRARTKHERFDGADLQQTELTDRRAIRINALLTIHRANFAE
jgi:hypothetical protein